MPAFVEPLWVKNAKQTIGTGVEPVYPMKTVHGGNQVPDTEANPIGYRYDNGRSQYQYLDLTGKPTDLVSRGNLGEAIRTLAPIGLSMIGANFLGPALGDLFGGSAALEGPLADLMGTSSTNISNLGMGANLANAAGAGAGVLPTVNLSGDLANLMGTKLTDVASLGMGNELAAGAGAGGAAAGAVPIGGALSSLMGADATDLASLNMGADLTTGAGAGPGVPPVPSVIPPVVKPPVVEPPVVKPPVVEPPVVKPPVVEPPVVDPVVKPPVVTPPVDTSWLTSLTSLTGLTGTQLAALLSGITGAGNAANLTSAINTGLDATTAANTASQGVLKDIYNQQLGFQKPYQATGTNALSQLGALGTGQYQQYDPITGLPTTTGTGSGYLQHQFDATDLAKGLAPNYDFMLQQGQMANQRAANVGGGALSGNTLQGLNKYTQDYAGNAYQNAFTNYQNQRQNIYNNLSGLAGIGQTANTGAQAAGTSYGKGTTDLQTALANAQAAASIGKAQAVAGGTTGLANSTFLSSLLGQNTSPAATTNNAGNVLSSLTGGASNFLSSLFGNNTTTSGNLKV